MNYILFDDDKRAEFLPLTYTSHISGLLIGMFTNRDRWQRFIGAEFSVLTATYLSKKFPLKVEDDNILINGRLFPDKEVLAEISRLKSGQKLLSGEDILAMRLSRKSLEEMVPAFRDWIVNSDTTFVADQNRDSVSCGAPVKLMRFVWDFFALNGEVFKRDLPLLDRSSFNQQSGTGNLFIGNDSFIHKNAVVNASVINSNAGPVIIDDGAEVMEGCLLRGPIYVGKNAVVKMGAKIYGPTSLGEASRIGGEVNNSVVNAYSNKGHDGFIGNTVIGRWCNLGADTNTSNLKNDYGNVKLWNYRKESFVPSGLQFLGLIMGDHSKCAINTMFNTGTVVGVSCNIHGGGFQPNFIPSFSWGKPGAFATYKFKTALEVAGRVMERRNTKVDEVEEEMLRLVFDQSEALRNKFNKTP